MRIGPIEGAARVAIVLPNLRGGGAERVAVRLAEDMAARGCAVDLVLLQARGELIGLPSRRIRIVELGSARILGSPVPLIRYLRSARPQAMLVSMWPLTLIGWFAWRLAGRNGPLVLSDHSLLSRQYASQGWLHRLALKLSTRFVYPLASTRVAVSQAVADDLASLSGLAPSRFRVINNPVAGPPQAEPGDEAVAGLWGDAEHRILSVGGLKDEKRQDVLLRAFARLAERRDARLVIVGDGPRRAELESLAASLGISDRLVFAGFRHDVWPFYRAASLFALSSDIEGFPLVICEAMHCGLNVVSTGVGGITDMLADGVYGELVGEGDEEGFAAALERGLERPVDCERQRRRAEQVAGQVQSDLYFSLLVPPRAAAFVAPVAVATDPA